ncbi:Lar family restriction alleviation protein [Yersinia enterocolitica]|uniref:Lar family restriction alleviation protein n=1 Tax=Yersinia enterocolitica TaxID=630 RepID=UPI003D79CAEA
MSENTDKELKPCPFCESTNIEAFAQYEEDCPDRSAIARCHGCDAQSAQMIGSGKVAMAIRAWNKRIS